MIYKILKIVFLVWVALWLSFVARELFRKGYIHDYRELLIRDLDGKRSYVAGDRFYEFILFSKSELPQDATFDMIGVKEGSIDKRRAVYYIYPAMKSDDPDYILVYDTAGFAKSGYNITARLDDSRYILKRGR